MIRPIEMPFIDWCRHVIASEEYVLADTETTDKYGEVIDLAIIDARGRALYNKLLRPVGAIGAEAEKIHHINTAMVENAPTLIDEWYEICVIVGNRTVITYNAKFDRERIFYSLHKHRMHLCPECQWTYQCAMIGYAEFWNAPPKFEGAGPAWQKLRDACTQQGITLPPGLHRAKADCDATLALLSKVAATGLDSPTYSADA